MESFFAKPTPQTVVEYIYSQVIFVHETGGKSYKYPVLGTLSISFINDVIDRLCDYVHDADMIEYRNDHIAIDWS